VSQCVFRWSAAAWSALVLVAVLVGGRLAPITSAQATGLVAAFGFEEGSGTRATDSSGTGNHGTLSNGGWTTAGHNGGGLLLNGSNAMVVVPDAPSLRLTSAATLEAWVLPTAISNAWRDVIYKADDNYYLEATTTTSSRPGIGFVYGTTHVETFATAALAANAWAHLAASYDGANIRLYVNGTQVATRARTGNVVTSSNPVTIGGDQIYGQFFAGTIDDVRIYNRALSAAEIQTDMNTAVGGTVTPTADLTPTKSHAGSFTQGQVGATYSVTVRNAGTAATNGTVTVADTLPAGLTATALNGTGWTCTVATTTCTRADALAAGGSYPPITVTVNVANNAAASVTNTVTVSGGGDANAANNSASDATTIVQVPDLTVSKSHAGNFSQGQIGARYTLTVSNVGAGATSGTVTVVDTLPAGLTASAIGGTGWTCTLSTLTCTQSAALASGASYGAITLTVNVSTSAPASVTNIAAVSGGGQTNTANDSATDWQRAGFDGLQDAQRQLHAGTGRGDLFAHGDQRRHGGDDRYGHADRHAAGRAHCDGDERHGLELHDGDADVHSRRRARWRRRVPDCDRDGKCLVERCCHRHEYSDGVGWW
jgi:uncharacterized repeat protein (TIGR01451 family)